MRVNFSYSIGDTIRVIHAPDITGQISAMSVNHDGLTYRIVWWDSGKRFEEWLEGWEIEGTEKCAS